jgi:hypothetical protein
LSSAGRFKQEQAIEATRAVRNASAVSPDLTVRQVVASWPACAEVLRSYPAAQSDGRWTLQELRPFARDCGLQEDQLLARLAAAAGVAVSQAAVRPRAASPISLIFIALVVALTLGAGWGVMLLLRIATAVDYGAVPGASVQVHGVAQLWGWMALFIFAIATHLVRQNTTRPAPRWMEQLAAGLIIIGLLAFFAGLSQRVRGQFAAIDIAGSSCLLLAAVLFGLSISRSLSGAAKTQRRHGLIFLIAWLWIWAACDVAVRLRYRQMTVLPDPVRALLIILPVLGIGTNAIYGFGIRLIPGLLNIGRLRPRFVAFAMLLHNVGLCLFIIPQRRCGVIGAGLMFVASILYLIGIDFLRSKPSRPIYGIDVRGHILIRVAFFWLLCGLGMIVVQQFYPGLPHAYSGAWRHALTVGFITTMILGVGQRLVPIFIRQPLASNRLMLLSAALIIVGNAGRVVLELATIGNWRWTFRLMGATGLLELTAIFLFALNLALTVRRRRHVYAAGESVTPDSRVREVVNALPEIQQRLRAIGVTMFDEVPFIAPSMTFGALALSVGRDPREMLMDLRTPGAINPESTAI